MWPSQKVGGGGEVEIPPSLCFPPKHLINSLKERCNVFCIYTCLNPKVKGHLFMSPFQAHKKWDDWVEQGCLILLLCDGLQVIPTELFKGEGAEGRERTIYNKLLKKIILIETLLYIYTYHMIIRLNFGKVYIFL